MYSKLTHIIFLCLTITSLSLTCTKIGAQCNNDITLSTQDEVDSFTINFNCTIINGDLLISGSNITNLDSLYVLDTLLGDLEIKDNDSLINLRGLQNLSFANRSIEVESNPNLISLDGLEGLVTIKNDFIVSENDSLQDITALDSNVVIFGNIEIGENPNLETCDAYWICNHVFCDRRAVISENGGNCFSTNVGLISCGCQIGAIIPLELGLTRQVDIDMLPSYFALCPFEVKELSISGESVNSLDSLYFIDEIEQKLTIEETDSVYSLSGLENLSFVDRLTLSSNGMLSDISMLNTSLVITRSIQIIDNDSLSECTVEWLCNVLDCYLGEYDIEGNKDGCSSNLQAVQGCPCVADITYIDLFLHSQPEIDSIPSILRECPAEVRTLSIQGDQIFNLDSLIAIKTVASDLYVRSTSHLMDLKGLDSIRSVGGFIDISNNDSLLNLSGLENLKAIGFGIQMNNNDILKSIGELDSLVDVGSEIIVFSNDSLIVCNSYWICQNLSKGIFFAMENTLPGCQTTQQIVESCVCAVAPIDFSSEYELNSQADVDGLPALFACGLDLNFLNIRGSDISNLDSLYVLDSLTRLAILDCDSLINIEGLKNIRSLREFTIEGCALLDNVAGLDSAIMINELTIINNQNLGVCAEPWLCANLAGVSQLSIADNAPGCNSNLGVATECNCSDPSGPVNVTLFTQSGVDSFRQTIGDCNIRIGNLAIAGFIDVTNLDSLMGLDSIFGSLQIFGGGPDNQIDFSGLSNLLYVGESFELFGTGIKNLDAFSSINYIGEDLLIDDNDSLMDISGLDSFIVIKEDIGINDNRNLSVCGVYWLCQFLRSDEGDEINIMRNAPGCNTAFDLIDQCGCDEPIKVRMDLELMSQEDVDIVPEKYGVCPYPLDDLLIGFDDGDFLEDFDFQNETIIHNLDSLVVIDSIFDDLVIRNNKLLADITGLQNLVFVFDDVTIEQNETLSSLEGLSGLSKIPGDLVIFENNKLIDLNGFENLEAVGNELQIEDNPQLTSIDALVNVKSLGGNLEIEDNQKLSSISGLSSLMSVGNNVNISRNLSLTSLYGLHNLEFIGNDLRIDRNLKLDNISDLANVKSVGRQLRLTNNSTLSLCGHGWICRHVAAGKPYLIGENKPGCNSIYDLTQGCLCNENLVLDDPDGFYRAKNSIMTLDDLEMQDFGVYDAPEILLTPGFEVPKGTSLWLLSEGCDE